jgi:CO dehydrogenase/acetyl-CoA synthase delta subunit
VDLFMMMHPAAIRTMKDTVELLMQPDTALPEHLTHWATMKI